MGMFGDSDDHQLVPQFIASTVVKERLSESELLSVDHDQYGSGEITTTLEAYRRRKSDAPQRPDHPKAPTTFRRPMLSSKPRPLVGYYQKAAADYVLGLCNFFSATGLRVTNWFGYGWDYAEDRIRGPKTTSAENEGKKFPATPWWMFIYTYGLYAMLAIFAIFVEVLRWFGLIQHCSHHENPRLKNFVRLYTDFEAFFTRNMYGYAKDVWSRPISSCPDATFDVIDRRSEDFGWTFEFPGTSTSCINLSSYNYLGFAQTSGPCTDAAADSIGRYGLGICSSRQEFGNQTVHSKLESMVADFLGVEDAVCFSMGFATNSMNIPCFASKGCLIISDELNHSSLILGCRLSGATIRKFKHNDLQDLETKLIQAIRDGQERINKPFKKILIFVEGIYSMEGTIVNLPGIIELKKRYKAYLYLDEAHSMGALGPNGRGVCDYFGCDPRDVDILMGTFSKSFASVGGYIAGRKEIIDHLRVSSHSSCYGGSLSAPVAQQVISIMSTMMGKTDGLTRVNQLARNTVYFRRRLRQLGFIIYGDEDAPVVPLMLYDPLKLITFSRELLARRVGAVVVGFPATSLLLARARFCISAAHTKEILDRALEAIDSVGEELGAKFARRRYRPNEAIEY